MNQVSQNFGHREPHFNSGEIFVPIELGITLMALRVSYNVLFKKGCLDPVLRPLLEAGQFPLLSS